jgi:photoactive yellow protein
MSGNRLPQFEEIGIGPALDRLSPDRLNHLPYGTVKVTTRGRVLLFSEREGELSGFLPEKALGQHWLVDVAPCMDSPRFRELLAEADAGPVDLYLADLHDFRRPQQAVQVRMVSSSEPGVCWLLVRRV